MNYIRRLKTRRKSVLKEVTQALEAMPELEALKGQREKLEEQKRKLEQPLKYIYVMERVEYKSGKHKGRANWHFHAFFTGGLSAGRWNSFGPRGCAPMQTDSSRIALGRWRLPGICPRTRKAPSGIPAPGIWISRWCPSRRMEKSPQKGSSAWPPSGWMIGSTGRSGTRGISLSGVTLGITNTMGIGMYPL